MESDDAASVIRQRHRPRVYTKPPISAAGRRHEFRPPGSIAHHQRNHAFAGRHGGVIDQASDMALVLDARGGYVLFLGLVDQAEHHVMAHVVPKVEVAVNHERGGRLLFYGKRRAWLDDALLDVGDILGTQRVAMIAFAIEQCVDMVSDNQLCLLRGAGCLHHGNPEKAQVLDIEEWHDSVSVAAPSGKRQLISRKSAEAQASPAGMISDSFSPLHLFIIMDNDSLSPFRHGANWYSRAGSPRREPHVSHIEDQWPAPHGGRRSRDAAVVSAARPSGNDRHEVR